MLERYWALFYYFIALLFVNRRYEKLVSTCLNNRLTLRPTFIETWLHIQLKLLCSRGQPGLIRNSLKRQTRHYATLLILHRH